MAQPADIDGRRRAGLAIVCAAMSFWMFDWILERRADAPTPLILKVAIIVQGILVVSQTRPAGMITDLSQILLYPTLWTVEVAVLVALWKMKRWPVIILAVYALLHAATAMPHYFAVTPRSLPAALFVAAIILALHNIALISALPFWRRMTWK
jgi:hypothetical protein